MCIIILQPPNSTKDLTTDVFQNSFKRNNDGAGIAYVNKKGSISTYKTLSNLNRLEKHYKEARRLDSPVILHFRIATHGAPDIKNCHPFHVSKDLIFAHNGVISTGNTGFLSNEYTEKRSDSVIFNNTILQKIPIEVLKSHAAKELLSAYVEFNKLAFLSADKSWWLINGELGRWDWDNKSVWFSNDSWKAVEKSIFNFSTSLIKCKTCEVSFSPQYSTGDICYNCRSLKRKDHTSTNKKKTSISLLTTKFTKTLETDSASKLELRSAWCKCCSMKKYTDYNLICEKCKRAQSTEIDTDERLKAAVETVKYNNDHLWFFLENKDTEEIYCLDCITTMHEDVLNSESIYSYLEKYKHFKTLPLKSMKNIECSICNIHAGFDDLSEEYSNDYSNYPMH